MNLQVFGLEWYITVPAYILIGAVYGVSQQNRIWDDAAVALAGILWPIHGAYFCFALLIEGLANLWDWLVD